MKQKKYNKTLIINLFAGPGSGKSVMAAELFSKLKRLGIETEFALEYAKDKVWEESLGVFENQVYIFAKQHHRIFRLLNKVQVIVTDSPIILSAYYDKSEDTEFMDFVVHTHKKLGNTINLFVQRRDENYKTNGRYQDLAGAKVVDEELKEVLKKYNIEYKMLQDSEEESNKIVKYIIEQL